MTVNPASRVKDRSQPAPSTLGPRPKPLPTYGPTKADEEQWKQEDLAAEIELQEFGPLPVAEEKCDRDYEAMEAEDLSSFWEDGRVR